MTPEVGDFVKDVLEKVLQKNIFECNNCGTQIEYVDENRHPLFPCQVCEKVDWRVYSINEKVIYTRSR